MLRFYCLAVLLVIGEHCVSGGSVNFPTKQSQLGRSGIVNYVQKTAGEPWPLPQVYKRTNNRLYLGTNFGFNADETCSLIDSAFSRYIYDIGPVDETTCDFSEREDENFTPLRLLQVNIDAPCVDTDFPNETMCENYTLTITQSSDTATLTACSIWGALRGLETFRQLLVTSSPEPLCVLVNESVIVDYPRFSHRGLMIDTSRHYLDMLSIYQSVDAIAQNKMNVLHWHIVDDQSFPYVSSTFPDLAEKGAYTNQHTYTVDDVQNVIEYARVRGIRVIPEFDTPGHTQSWGVAYPELLAPCFTGGKPNGDLGPMDPSLDSTFNFVQKLFEEIAQVFPDKYMHIGGDEVSFSCWASNPNITAFMSKMGFGQDYRKLENYYIQKILPFVVADKKTGVLWQEIFDDDVDLPTDQVIVHVWKSGWQQELASVTKKGYRTLLSSPFYFNYISYGVDWLAAYEVEPLNFTGTAQQQSLVVGGEACMWGEYVDSSNLLTRTWPRAAAFAERFWSSKQTRNTEYATRRLEEQRCRMIKRGLVVEPVSGSGYCDDEPKPRYSPRFDADSSAVRRNKQLRRPVNTDGIL